MSARSSGGVAVWFYGIENDSSSHYLGQYETHPSQLMIATAMDIVRTLRWLAGEPKAAVNPSAFQQLHLATA